MSIKREVIRVYDMTCISCQGKIENELRKVNGVVNAMASYSDEQVTVEYDIEVCTNEQLQQAINKAGYNTTRSSNSIKFVGFFVVVAAILLIGRSTAGFDMSAKLNGASYMVLFIVGMLTSIHCVGMCGGIMITQSISKEKKNKIQTLMPTILYNAGRVISYTIILQYIKRSSYFMGYI